MNAGHLIVGGLLAVIAYHIFRTPRPEENPWRAGEVVPPEHVQRARFFLDEHRGRRREVEVAEYEPNYYSVWEIHIPGDERGEYVGVLLDEGGLWKAKPVGEYSWELFPSKRAAAQWLAGA